MDEQQQEFYREQHEINRGFIAHLDAMAIESAESRKRDADLAKVMASEFTEFRKQDAGLAKVLEKLLDFVNDMDDRFNRNNPPC